jgi:hypothetical protein
MAQAIDRMREVARRARQVRHDVGGRSHRYGARRGLLRKGVRMISYSADALVFRRACQDIAV